MLPKNISNDEAIRQLTELVKMLNNRVKKLEKQLNVQNSQVEKSNTELLNYIELNNKLRIITN